MDEKDLVAQVQNGDSQAFQELVSLHYRSVYHVAMAYMKDHAGADDVVQESFVKAFKSIGRFRGDSSFKSWLTRITINTAKNALRSRKRHQGSDLEKVELPSDPGNYNKVEQDQTRQLLREGISALPPKQRLVLELRIFEEMSFKEVAAAMESPFDTAKANFRHALANLRKWFSQAEEGKDLETLRIALQESFDDS